MIFVISKNALFDTTTYDKGKITNNMMEGLILNRNCFLKCFNTNGEKVKMTKAIKTTNVFKVIMNAPVITNVPKIIDVINETIQKFGLFLLNSRFFSFFPCFSLLGIFTNIVSKHDH